MILTHPKVQDVGVVGIPEEMSGEIPCAFVVKKANMDLTESEIIKYVAGKFSDLSSQTLLLVHKISIYALTL